MFQDQPDILSVEEVCELLRVGKQTVYQLMAQGELKGYRSGRLWHIPKQAVEEYIVQAAKLKPY